MSLQVYHGCRNPLWQQHLAQYNHKLSQLIGFGSGKAAGVKLVIKDCTEKWILRGGVFLENDKQNEMNEFKVLSFVKKALRTSREANQKKARTLKMLQVHPPSGRRTPSHRINDSDDGNDIDSKDSLHKNENPPALPSSESDKKKEAASSRKPRRRRVLPKRLESKKIVPVRKQEQPKKQRIEKSEKIGIVIPKGKTRKRGQHFPSTRAETEAAWTLATMEGSKR